MYLGAKRRYINTLPFLSFYAHLRVDCLYTGISSGRAQRSVSSTRESFTFYLYHAAYVQCETMQPLSEKELNGRGFYYLVKYKLLRSPGPPQSITVDDPSQSEVVVHDRETFRRYEISVQSANEIGPSTQQVTPKIGYSGEGSK